MSKLNYEHVFNTLVEETAKYITKNNLKAMVLGISGGIDSTVVAAICHEVSKKTGIPLIGRSLPIKNKSDVSELVGQVFCDDFKVVNLLNMYQHVNQSVYDGEGTLGTPISKGNIQARLSTSHYLLFVSCMKLYYLFLLVMFFLFNSCVEQTPRTKSVAPISVRDTTKRTSRSHLWNSNTSTYKKTKSSYTPSKKTYKRKSSYKSRSRRYRR